MADLEVRGGRAGFDERLYARLARLPGVAVASPMLELDAGLAGPGEVLVSGTTRDLLDGSGLSLEPRGEHELKGVPDRWHLYRVTGN